MQGIPYKRQGRWFQELLIAGLTFCAMLPYIAVSVIMPDIMQTFGADITTVALAMTVQLVMSGMCMFIGSMVSDRIGAVKTAKVGITCLFLGALIQGIAPSIGIFIVGRAIAGLGQGLGTVNASPLVSSWFDGKERSYALTCNSMASMIAIALTVAIIRPLSAALGGWQRAYLAYAVFTLVFVVLWMLFGRSNPELEAQAARKQQMAAAMGKGPSSLSLALKEPQCWKCMIFFGLFIIVDTARATFMPTFMGSVGIPEGILTTATSMLSLVGMVGSLLGGVLVAQIWCRKPIVLTGAIGYIIAGLLCTFVTAPMPNALFVILLGFFYNITITANSMLMIENAMGKNPMMISGGVAMMSGVGMLLTIVVSPIFSGLMNSFGMAMAFRIFFLVMIIGVVAVISEVETGRKPQAQ